MKVIAIVKNPEELKRILRHLIKIVHSLTLVTLNVRDFQGIGARAVESWA